MSVLLCAGHQMCSEVRHLKLLAEAGRRKKWPVRLCREFARYFNRIEHTFTRAPRQLQRRGPPSHEEGDEGLAVLRVLGECAEVPFVMLEGAWDQIGDDPEHKQPGSWRRCQHGEPNPLSDLRAMDAKRM